MRCAAEAIAWGEGHCGYILFSVTLFKVSTALIKAQLAGKFQSPEIVEHLNN